MTVRILTGDCRDVLATLPEASIDSCVTDPPYHLTNRTPDVKWCVDCHRVLGGRDGSPSVCPRCGGQLENQRSEGMRGFMGKVWDGGDVAFRPETWAAVYRVLKPGAHLLAFGGTRTYHRLACAIEDAGFEIRDQIGWAYGSGFPKSHNLGTCDCGMDASQGRSDHAPTCRSIREAEWRGWGTALKPSWEPICVARKPLGSPEIPVREIVEHQLRLQGVDGEIVWRRDSASGAAKSKTTVDFGSTRHSAPSGTFAEIADGSETLNYVPPIPSGSVPPCGNGSRTIPDDLGSTPARPIVDCESKSSPPTETPAPAAAKQSQASSPSTTSTAAEPLTENQSAAGSTPNSVEMGSPMGTESFAGIATGLTGSLAHVHIRRRDDGSFSWPADLPEKVPARSLTVAANVIAHGSGALNIDGCRVESEGGLPRNGEASQERRYTDRGATSFAAMPGPRGGDPTGRWPANLVHDGSDEVLACFPETKSGKPGILRLGVNTGAAYGAESRPPGTQLTGYGDEGSAARFYYCAKSSRSERGEGNDHPTVKPVDLMRWLVRLVTPPGGTVLDPFAGSGTTGLAASIEQLNATLIELDPKHAALARDRINSEAGLFAPVAAE